MVLGALTRSHFTLHNPLVADDTIATLDALHALGAEIRNDASGMRIHCDTLRAPHRVIDAKNSGTTARLVSGLVSLFASPATLTGDESLLRRPMGPLMDALAQLGASHAYLGRSGCLPLTITGPIERPSAEIVGDVSSQFVSSLLIACTQKKGDTAIRVKGMLRSRPYVDITLGILREFGAHIDESNQMFTIPGNQQLVRESYSVPGDFSSASFPLAAAAITGGSVTVRNLDIASPQGDRAIAEHLGSFGARVAVSAESVGVSAGRLEGTEIDVRHTPDLFPILAVLGSVARGETVLKGGETLREKESDRIATTTTFLRDMGANIEATQDGCRIVGVERLHGAVVQTQGDHRILMAAAVAGLASTSDTRIEDDASFKISYPGFVRDMHQLGCRLEVRR